MDINILGSFKNILTCFTEGEAYRSKPPQGPPETWRSLSSEELEAIFLTDNGESRDNKDPYAILNLLPEDGYIPKNIVFPGLEILSDLNIYGIDGSNQKVEKSAFYLIMARAAIINFRYSADGSKPYFKNKQKDASALMLVDQNVFDLDKINVISNHADLNDEVEGKRIGRFLNSNSPLSFRYDVTKTDKSPSSQALGVAVKIMQTLELMCLEYIDNTKRAVCIKDGPLFSPSVSVKDAIEYLSKIETWTNQILISCSKRVRDSRLLLQALKQNIPLRSAWFPNDFITDNVLNGIASDSVLLPRILRPGQRTPLFEAVPVARQQIVSESGGNPNLTPLTCYYLSRTKPHTYLRLEVPKLFWNRNRQEVEEAISVVAWQHELGRIAPLVQIVADERCQLSSEAKILQRQTDAALKEAGLDFLQDY